jgi:hypothetical protein
VLHARMAGEVDLRMVVTPKVLWDELVTQLP